MTRSGATTITLDEAAGEAVLAVDGDERWRYVYGARKRPFVHPLRTPAGRVLTRNAPEDHPWHHGLWFTIKFVNGENFWEEYDEYGVLRHTAPPVIEPEGDRASLRGSLTWIRPDRETVIIREDRRLAHVPLDDDDKADRAYALDFVTTLVPEQDVTLDRTPFTTWGGYGGLAFRGRGDLTDTRLLRAGGEPQDRVLGERGSWLDLSGTVASSADGGPAGPAGIAILDHPDNPGHPVPWYASTRADTYGDEGWSNFANAAFLWDAPLEVTAHTPLTFAYRVIVHDGIWEQDRLVVAYADYLAGLGSAPA